MMLQFITTNLGYASGVDGPLLKTTDAGESWDFINFSNITQQKLGGSGLPVKITVLLHLVMKIIVIRKY